MTNGTNPAKGFSFFSSWSGGKDSCLALNRMVQAGNTCSTLFTTLDEAANQSCAHRIHPDVLKAQAAAMGIPLLTTATTWETYEERFKTNLCQLRERGITHGVFGDIDLEPHREWVERVCRESGITEHQPLWLENRRDLVQEFIDAGFKAMIVVVNTSMMPAEFLGRQIDAKLIGELESIGVDACGENGEFHTLVYGGGLFKYPLEFKTGAVVSEGPYVFLPVTVS